MIQGKIKVQFRQQKVAILKNVDAPIYLYVPSIDRYSTIEEDAIIKYAAKAANIAENDMRATFEALADAFEFFLTNGHSFKVDGVGTFSLSVRAKQAQANDANAVFGADAVSSVGINFLADKTIKQLIESASIETETIPEPTVPDMTALMLRKLTLKSGAVLISDGADNAMAGAIAEGEEATINGYNLDSAASIPYSGTVGTGEDEEEVSGLFTYKPSGKAGLQGVGVFSDAVDVITEFGGIALTAAPTTGVTRVNINGSQIVSGQSYSTGASVITLFGSGLRAMNITFGGQMVTRTKNTDSEVSFVANITSGANAMVLGTTNFAIFGVEGKVAHVSTLTANGVTCTFGESSPVIAGRTYQFVALGENLGRAPILYPFGEIDVKSNSNERIQFDLTVDENANSADIQIGDFVVTLTVTSSAPVVVNCNGTISDGETVNIEPGTYPLAFNFASAVPESDRAKLKAYHSATGEFTVTWSADGKVMSYSGGYTYAEGRTYPIRVTYNEATIFDFVLAPTAGGKINVD